MKPSDLEAYVQTRPELLQLRQRITEFRKIGENTEPHEWAQPIQRPRGAPVCDCEGCEEDSRDPLRAAKGIALGVGLALAGWALIGLLLWWGLVR